MKPARILWVESDKAIADNLTRLMTRKGFSLCTVSDEGGALQALEEQMVDVLVVEEKIAAEADWKLFKAAKRKNPRTQVILLKNYPSGDRSCLSPPFEVFAFIQKPFRWDDLIKKIKDGLSGPIL